MFIIFFIIILISKNSDKSLQKFDGNKYFDNLEPNNKDFSLFLLNYKSLNETISLDNSIKKNILPRVAHAAGGFNDQTYTNSIDALNENKKDFLFFEIDFRVTNDNKVVCEHDNNENLKSFEYFQEYIKKNKLFKQCTYISLRKWLQENPKKIIITDFKNENIKGLNFISEKFENYENRFIPQIYHPKEYNIVKKMGFKNIIWTLYKYNQSNDSVLLFSEKMNLYAVTMSRPRALSGLAGLLKEKQIKTYVHTINTLSNYYKYLNLYDVDQIYTDWVK